MADSTKAFNKIQFALPASGRQSYETANGSVVYFAEGAGIAAGTITLQFDDDETLQFAVAVGDFIRIPGRFTRIRLINNLAVAQSGLIIVSTDPDFLFMNFPRGI